MAIEMSNESVRFYPLDQWKEWRTLPPRDMSRQMTSPWPDTLNQSLENVSLSGDAHAFIRFQLLQQHLPTRDLVRREAFLSPLDHLHRQPIGVNRSIPIRPNTIHMLVFDACNVHQ